MFTQPLCLAAVPSMPQTYLHRTRLGRVDVLGRSYNARAVVLAGRTGRFTPPHSPPINMPAVLADLALEPGEVLTTATQRAAGN